MTRNLLHVCNDLPYWIAHRRSIAEAARDAGWKVTVATAAPADSGVAAGIGFPHIALPIERFQFSPALDGRLFLAMRRLMDASRFDAVHLFTIKPLLIGGLAARFADRRGGTPRIIGTVAGMGRALDHSDSPWRATLTYRGLAAGLGKAAAAVTFENAGDRNFYVANGSVAAPRTHVFPGAGVDLALFKPAAARRDPNLVTVLFAGRLLRSKGVMDVVGTAKILNARFGNMVRVLVAGQHTDNDPDGLNAAERQALEQGGDVVFLGARAIQDMPELMASADIFVLPTRYPEGLPRVLLEAGATGAALVAGDVDGTRAFIDDHATGLLLIDTEAATIADTVAALVTDPALRYRLGAAARAKLEQGGYGTRDIAARFLELYEDRSDRRIDLPEPTAHSSVGQA